MLDETNASLVADEIDLHALGACPLCLLELACELRADRKPSRRLVATTADWVWLEIANTLTEAVVQARMREVPHAEDALNDLETHSWRSPLVRVVVLRLADELAAELSR